MKRLFKFCPRCKKKIFQHRNKFFCEKCDFVFWVNPAPSSGAVIIKNQKILLAKRAGKPKKGYWDIPGGYLNPGESPKRALRREIKEELGVKIKIGGLIGFFPDVYGPQNLPNLNIFYFAEITDGKIKPATDISEVKWFSLEKPIRKLAFQNTKEVVKVIIRINLRANPKKTENRVKKRKRR